MGCTYVLLFDDMIRFSKVIYVQQVVTIAFFTGEMYD